MKNPLQIFRREEALLTEDDIRPSEFARATELEVYASRTRDIIVGLDEQISTLERQIEEAIAALGDKKRIRDSQNLALRYMEGDI